MDLRYNNNLIPYLYEGVYVVDKKRQIVFWNEGSERITGYKASEVTNSYCHYNILQHIDENGKQLCLNGCPLQQTLDTGIIHEKHVFLKHKEGYRIPVMVKSLPIYDHENNIVAAIEVFTDERFQKDIYHENIELKDKLKTDPLTKIANRHYFDFQIARRVEEAKLFNRVFGVLIIDIDRFKIINDTHGHLVGDEVLKVVANSLVANVQRTDTISRWGGEEFVGIMDIDNLEALFKVAERLRNIVKKSTYALGPKETISVTISIGGTLFHKDDDVNTLMSRADQNMYVAKQKGRDQANIK